MTLRQVILSVSESDFRDNTLFQQLKDVKPEYGSNIRIKVYKRGEVISVTNVHVGSLGDMNERVEQRNGALVFSAHKALLGVFVLIAIVG